MSNPEDQTLLELFCEEVKTHVQTLNEGLLSLESTPENGSTIESLMRAAHSIKGAARVVNIESVVEIAHLMEDCFETAKRKEIKLTGESIDSLFKSIDYLSLFTSLENIKNPPTEELSELKNILTKILSKDFSPQKNKEVPSSEKKNIPSLKDPLPEKKSQEKKAISTVRVSSGSLNKLMGLAAESLVETKRLTPFSESLVTLKKDYQKQDEKLARAQEAVAALPKSSRALSLIGEIRNRSEVALLNLSSKIDHLEAFIRHANMLSDQMYREVIASRMRPFSEGIQGFPRMVRDLSKQLGKKIDFEIIGENTPVDRDILEKLEAPLNHILRNAIDHGIEKPKERLQKGKPEKGIIKITASHRAGMLLLEINDDGKGINLKKLRDAIVEKKLTSKELSENLSENELLEFLLLPGFSTHKEVTEISGRGVGLDVVQTKLQEIGGFVRIKTKENEGTTFHLQLPLTRSVIRSMVAEINKEPYAFPLSRVGRTLKMKTEDIITIEGSPFIKYQESNIGLVSAANALEIEKSSQPQTDTLSVILLGDKSKPYGLVVDNLLGEYDLVIRPLDSRLGKVPNINAAALLENGKPVLIIDIDDLIQSINTLLEGGRLGKAVHSKKAKGIKLKRRKTILVVDDSITVRETEKKLLKNKGYEVDTAVDGMDAWNAISMGNYDLIITDIDMPRMNGFELVYKIRSDSRFEATPIIIVSYKDRKEDRIKGLNTGANYYLTKTSFQDESFLEAVEELIGKGFSL